MERYGLLCNVGYKGYVKVNETTCDATDHIQEKSEMLFETSEKKGDIHAKKHSKGSLALKAGVWYVISNVMIKAVSIITTPIFTRILSTSEYGTVQTFSSWHSLLLPFFSLNLTYSIGRAKLDFKGKLKEYVGSMQVLGSLFSVIIILLTVIFIEPVSFLFELTPFQTVMLVVYMTCQVAILLNQNKYRYTYQYKQNIAIAWYTVIATTVLSILLIFIIKDNKDDLRIIGLVIPSIALSLFFWIKNTLNKSICINREYWAYGLRLSLPLILHTVSLHVLSQSDRIFITKICGKTDTAYYSLAYQLGALLSVITTAVSQGWLPWFHETYYAKNYSDIRKNVKPIVVLGCYIGMACIAFAPEAIIVLGGAKYRNSIPCVAPVVQGIICQYVYTHYVNIELHLKKTIYVSMGTIIAAIFNTATNAIFIPRFGFIAAAYTTLASYFLLMIIHVFLTRRVLYVKIYDDCFMFAVVSVTSIIAIILEFSYEYIVLRCLIVVLGFASFLYYFREYILFWWNKTKDKIKASLLLR